MKRDAFYAKHTKLTRSLKDFVANYEKTLASDVFEKFLGSLDEEIENARGKIMAAPGGAARARLLQELVDHELRNDENFKPTCFKGCSACCHLEVEVTNYETEILSELIQNGHAIDEHHLEAQSQRAPQDPKWKESLRNGENQCVFLGPDKACSVYSHRPVMCRRHSVSSPPANCETVDGKITVLYLPRVDVLLAAASEDPELRTGPLAKMIRLSREKIR